jgi:hypothetical protein
MNQIMNVMGKNHSGPECTEFIVHDLYNFLQDIRRKESMQQMS